MYDVLMKDKKNGLLKKWTISGFVAILSNQQENFHIIYSTFSSVNR